MSWDFHPVENEQALADMKPLADIEPGFFSGMQWAPYQINRGFAVAGRALSLATSTPFILADKIRGGTELQDRYFHDVHEAIYQRAVDFWTPNPKEVGTAARVVGDLISTLPMAIAAPPLAILSAQMGTAEDLVRAGVPEGKAQAVGAIQGAGMGLGIWMPILGKNLWQRTVVGGAGFNTLQGVVTRGASGAILEGTPAEDQFKAFDGEAMTLDVLLGLGFGAFTHINPDARAQGAEAWDRAAKWAERFSPSQKAAIATLREAQHLNVDSTPGKPVAHADIEAHVNRMRTAIDQIVNDQPVDVENILVPGRTKDEPDDPLKALSDTTLQAVGDLGPGREITRGVGVTDADWALLEKEGLVQEGTTEDGEKYHYVSTDALVGERERRYQAEVQARKNRTIDPEEQAAAVERRAATYERVAAEKTEAGYPDEADQLTAKAKELRAQAKAIRENALPHEPQFQPDPVREQENIQRTADMINIAERIREEEGLPRLDDLNAAGKTVTERLLDLGIPAEEAQSKGLLFDSFFGAMAKHTGSTPEELMARYFGGISKDEGDGAGGMAEGNVDRLHSAIARYLGTEKSPFELTPETPADIAARARDAELAAQGDTEAQQRMQSRAAADVLREHFLGKKGGVPTPDKSSISQGLPHNGMQERPEVRADESGSLEEPAQSGSGAGNATNPNDIPAHVQEAVLKAVNKVQDADRKWAMEHEIRDEVVNTGAVSIKDLLKKERAEIQISEVTGLERTRFGWTASVRGEKITVPGSYSKKTAPQAIADAYAIDHGKVSASDLIDPETEELTDAGFEALNKATDAEIEARANAAFGKIESLDELNSVDHRTQWEAMKALVEQLGLDSKADASSGGSRYLTVEIGDESYKIRFADHFNTVRDSTMQPDFNVAPGRNTFTDAVKWLMGKLNSSAGSEKLFQGGSNTDDRSLIVQHNLTPENLMHALRMGGIPVPSLAITDKAHPLENFGSITLLGSKAMADPKGYARTKVFGADIYSPRYPRVEFQFTANMRSRAETKLKAGLEATKSNLDWAEIGKRGVETLRTEPAVRWQFLKDQGIEPMVVRVEPKPLPKALEAFAAGTRHAFELRDDPAFIKAAYKAHEDMLVDAYDGDRAAAKAEIAGMKKNAEERGVSYLLRDYAAQVERYQRETRESGSIDTAATNRAIENQIYELDLRDKLDRYASELLQDLAPNERIFKGYTYTGQRSYQPHTLENVVKILKKELRGGEGWNYGVGSLRAKFTPEFKSIKQIKENKGRLIDKAGFEAVKEEIDNDLVSIAEDLDLSVDQTIEVMENAPKMGAKKAIERANKDYRDGEEADPEQAQKVAEFLTRLRNLPTQYFEAKILRDVDLAEFSGAVVPEGVDPKVIEALKSRGVTDIRTYKKGDEADRAAKIGSFDNLLFQSAPTFYSELARQVDGLNVKSAPAQGWKDTVKGLVGKGKVKQAEIEATGLDDWLDLQPGKVSKEQVQAFLKNNGVTVEEVELGKSGASADITALERKYPDAVLADASNGKQGPMSDADFQTWQRATRRVRETEPSKFDEYQLPGGENYRELLLTLPARITDPTGWSAKEVRAKSPITGKPEFEVSDAAGNSVGIIRTATTEADAIAVAVKTKVSLNETFRSSHYPDHLNILAHIRFNERTDADGKRVLFLEELQSDWAQKGRKEGFDKNAIAAKPSQNEDGTWTNILPSGRRWGRYGTRELALSSNNLYRESKGIPPAPFITKTEAWTALALKRMIRYAAENGFDRIAWTNGEQQAARYDLSKTLSKVVVSKQGDLFKIGGTDLRGDVHDFGAHPAEKLEDIVGKELAAKIVQQKTPNDVYAGNDLKVGGEGMKGFYDKIVPTVANDVLKKFGGGKVGVVEIATHGKRPVVMPNGMIHPTKMEQITLKQPGFDITPALREKVMAGQPLFQDNRGYLQFGPGSKMSIGLLASADRSTFLHESGHFFLEVMNDLSKEIPALQGEMETVFKWLGVKDADAWSTMSLDEKRPYHEQWARGFEAYLMDGKAPNERLKSAFARFRDWLIEVYKSAVNLNVTLSDEVRGVMDRMLDSQAAHPSEPPRAPAEGAGTPPPGKVGEAPAARSDLDQALAAGKPNLTAPRGLEHPDIRETLQDMAANETGWAEVGGRMLRIPDASMESGERIDRTKWIPKEEWWAARPGPKRLNEAQVQEAVRKALAGEPMNAAEKRTVEFMREVANDRLDSVQQIGAERFGEMLEDAQLEDLPPTTETAFDSMTARRAYDLDLEAYEAAVDRYNVHEDDGLFMAEVRSIIHEAEQQRGAGSQDHPGGAAERGARPGEADPAAESAGQRSAPRDYVSTEAERIATDNPERRVHVGLDADDKPLTVTAREFLDNARKEADRIRQDANLFQIAGECLLSQL